jgi:hypothetical protein
MKPAGLPLPLPQPPITRVLLATICLSSGPDDAQSYFSLGGTMLLGPSTLRRMAAVGFRSSAY